MVVEISEKNIIFYAIFFVLLVIIFYFFIIFLGQNYWWIIPAFFYLMFFIFREYDLKKKDLVERLRLKDRREGRIDFWG